MEIVACEIFHPQNAVAQAFLPANEDVLNTHPCKEIEKSVQTIAALISCVFTLQGCLHALGNQLECSMIREGSPVAGFRAKAVISRKDLKQLMWKEICIQSIVRDQLNAISLRSERDLNLIFKENSHKRAFLPYPPVARLEQNKAASAHCLPHFSLNAGILMLTAPWKASSFLSLQPSPRGEFWECFHSSVVRIGDFGDLDCYIGSSCEKISFVPRFSIEGFAPYRQIKFMGECIRKGFVEIVAPFHRDVQEMVSHLRKNLEKKERRLACLQPPPPNSKKRAQYNGGDSNYLLYKSEYRKAVAFFWYALSMSFEYGEEGLQTLLEDLGQRRKRMAILGDLGPESLELFGMPANETMSTAYTDLDESNYLGRRIGAVYKNRLPFRVTYQTHKGVEIKLTTVTATSWEHEGYKARAGGMQELAYLTKCVLTQTYDTALDLAPDLHRIYWLFAHLAPFLRGTPTINGIFVDALWLVKGYRPPDKLFDENCEALVFDTWQGFSREMLRHQAFLATAQV